MSDFYVLFQDDQLIVCVKPYGLLSEEDEKKPSMPALLRQALGCEHIYPVHRLDRTTEGLMVYAKTEEAARRLSAAVQRGEMEKLYLCVVQGMPDPPAGECSDLLYYDRKKNKSYVVRRERKGVKTARLSYETLASVMHEGQTFSLLKIRLFTGRTHQIRVQLASRRLPLVGDRRYGSTAESENIALCAAELRFSHPFTGEELRFGMTPTDGVFGLFSDQRSDSPAPGKFYTAYKEIQTGRIMMDFDALSENLIYVLKESQMKLGYTDNAASLNYPPESLARLLGTEPEDGVLMKALRDFCDLAEPTLGRITVSVYDRQYCLTVPPKGVRYVRENVPESPFLRELIDLLSQHKAHGIAEVLTLFQRYSDGVVCRAVDGDGYDHILYFSDGKPDDFVYLFETAFGHVSYHRMTKADYEAEIGSDNG